MPLGTFLLNNVNATGYRKATREREKGKRKRGRKEGERKERGREKGEGERKERERERREGERQSEIGESQTLWQKR